MTAGSVTAAPTSMDALRAIGRHWRLPAFVALGFGPFVPSILSMRQFFLADNALGFIPFVFLIAAISFWQHAFPEMSPAKRDLVVDSFIAIPMGLMAAYTLRFMPDYLSWYFWLFRVDLLALPMFLVAAGVVCFGYQRALVVAPAFISMFLVWPYPIVRMQQYLIDPFVRLTTWLTGWAIHFFALPYVQDPAVPARFLSQHLEVDNFALVIAQTCAGTSTFIAFVLFAVASLAFIRGPWAARAWWIGLGLALTFAFNFVRIIALLLTAVTFNERVAVEVVHPVLGLALFTFEIVLMLALVRPFGLRFDRGPRGTQPIWVGAGAGGGRLQLLLIAVTVGGAIGIGVLDARAQSYSFLELGEGAPTVNLASDRGILVDVPDWTLEHLEHLDWTDRFCQNSGPERAAGRLHRAVSLRGAEAPDQFPPAEHEQLAPCQRCRSVVDSEVVVDLVERCAEPGR